MNLVHSCCVFAALLAFSIEPANAQVPDGVQSELLSTTLRLTVTPTNGQSRETQGADKTECYALSKDRTGVDPFGTAAPPDERRAVYVEAFTACLETRGYAIKR